MPKKVLITAGAAGIGRAIAEIFIENGDEVAIMDVDAKSVMQFQADFPQAMALQADLSNLSSLEQAFNEAIVSLKHVDVLVNNLGISGPTCPTESLPVDEWSRVVQINLTSMFYLTQLAIPYLKKSSCGSVVNMASAAGRFGYPNRIAYATTKWGVVGFTKTLAMELGADKIRVNAIAPGAVSGPRIEAVIANKAQLSGRSLEEEAINTLKVQSLKYMAEARDIGKLVYFLASEAGKSISGQLIPIDGDTQYIG